MLLPPVNEFSLVTPSVAIPMVSTGPTITPGNNAYGSYTQLIAGASVTDDVYGIWININAMAVSGSARDALVKIGVDPAGGSSYTDFVVDLSGSCAGAANGTGLGGIVYYFPLRVRAGTSIALAASVNNGTVGTCSAWCWLKSKQSHPERARIGSFVRTFGSTLASSSGTALTPGTNAKGSYVQLGSALVEPLWFWQIGVFNNNAVGNNNPLAFDLALGTASNKRIVIADLPIIANTAEALHYVSLGAEAVGAPGDLVYARAAAQGAPSTGWSAAAYGIGG